MISDDYQNLSKKPLQNEDVIKSGFEWLAENLWINNGGCCFIAYVVAKNLEKRNIPYSLMVYDYEDYSYEEVSDTLFVKSFNHYAIKTEYGIINGDSQCEDPDCQSYEFTDFDSESIYNLYKRNDWNSDYDTDENSFTESIVTLLLNRVLDELGL